MPGPTLSAPIDAALAARLVAEQFPRWSRLPVRPMAHDGWDNRTFRLGDDLTIRLPSAAQYALQVPKEHRWLPVLAPHLPLPIPRPVVLGRPTAAFPLPWSIYRWLDGEPVARRRPTDMRRFARDLAAFLVALRAVDPAGGPAPGDHNWWRGAPPGVYSAETDAAITAVADPATARAARTIWAGALAAHPAGAPVWFHGDVAAGNLLVRNGALAAVIDFGTCGIGDPACDLVVAWTLLERADRAVFRDAVDVDADTWARGRGWALWKALITLDGPDGAEAGRVLGEVLADPVVG